MRPHFSVAIHQLQNCGLVPSSQRTMTRLLQIICEHKNVEYPRFSVWGKSERENMIHRGWGKMREKVKGENFQIGLKFKFRIRTRNINKFGRINASPVIAQIRYYVYLRRN